ncbi:sel1 repeat family protein [Pseudoduganella violaceinigra]|uniref:sel1 repeat family protein n=1 Tax=Pseudoduganella violaceinigra TaxID=246602 RepID=UPI000414162F|nr:sel1 repeat family protein [Pseudoduganella violaceinigra]
MKVKALLLCLAVALGGPALADELADANKLLENKAYPQAQALFTKLANGGNAEAQFHLGEMYWYGEAGGVDLAQARNWFGKAAAAGNQEAAAALDTMAQREARHKDIAFWTGGYDGRDLTSGAFHCARPEFPAQSKTNDEIVRLEKAHGEWQKCYNGFVQNLGDALPPGKRIPQDISRLMNQPEYDQAIAHLDKVYRAVSRQEGEAATATTAAYQAWHKSTEQFVATRNAESKLEGDLAADQIRRANLSTVKNAPLGKGGK